MNFTRSQMISQLQVPVIIARAGIDHHRLSSKAKMLCMR